MSAPKKLFLLDAYALIFRGYYALIKNPRINSKGLDTSAVLGFMNSLLDVIKREKPDYLAVAFDNGGSQVRTELFPEYKANRDETPEAIRIGVPYIHKILEAMHIPIVELKGVEADDLIGTLSKQAELAGFQVYMVTPDKDYAQLVTDNVFMYKPARMGNGIEIWGVDQIKEKFEVDHPLQIIDLLGMMGDAIDNIPGLPGVGEKTAKKFIKEYGSLEALLENTHQLKGKMKENIEANKELGLLSKRLATIITDCDVQFDPELFELNTPDAEKVEEIFQDLEFRRMSDQFKALFYAKEAPHSTASTTSNESQMNLFADPDAAPGDSSPTAYDNITSREHYYQIVDNPMVLKLFLDKLLSQNSVCFDTETTGIDANLAELVGLSFSWEAGKAYYIPVSEDYDQAIALLNQLRPFFESEQIEKIGQNIKYDLKILMRYGVKIQGPLFDTMLAHYLINPDMRHNMDVLSETYLRYTPVAIETLIGKKGKNQLSMRQIPLEQIKEYAGEDADVTLQLQQHFAPILEHTGTRELFDKIEMPLVPVLAAMELEGIRLDVHYLKELEKTLAHDIAEIEQKIYETAGKTFNIASPKQLGEVLFDDLKLGSGKIKKTKTGQYATGEEILAELAPNNPIIQQILDYRQLVKLQSTYVVALPEQVNPLTERVHTDYMQAVAATGRLSSNNPNLQNIPIRTERGRLVRKAFVARDEQHVLVSADYSQIELRIIAALSGEPNMIEAFTRKEDIHRATAAKVFNVPIEEVTREQRSQAKTVNFGIIYGVSAFGLSQQTNLSRGEAKQLIDAYYATYPVLKTYIQQQIEFARENGYVMTVSGRRRYLKDINSANAVVRGAAERNAVNAPIQGSAADIIKLAMIAIHNKLTQENWKTKMLLQVHDELVFDAHKDELDRLYPMIQHEMENAFQLSVPLVVEIGQGENWLEAH